jgi:hypothetical protein
LAKNQDIGLKPEKKYFMGAALPGLKSGATEDDVRN